MDRQPQGTGAHICAAEVTSVCQESGVSGQSSTAQSGHCQRCYRLWQEHTNATVRLGTGAFFSLNLMSALAQAAQAFVAIRAMFVHTYDTDTAAPSTASG